MVTHRPLCPGTEAELDDLLSRPSPALLDTVRGFGDRLVVLGAGGKMGPTLAWMARRAADLAGRDDLEVVAVSRFTQPELRAWLEERGVRALPCDLLDPVQRGRLPDASEVIIMLGYKFAGGDTAESEFWGRNAFLPATLAERYRKSRIVCFSTGNVYPMVRPETGGCTEETGPAPVGVYAHAARGRELLVDFLSRVHGTGAVLLRLNYAVDLRYGVPVDIGLMLLHGEPVPLDVPYVNFVWQRYANEVALRSFELCAAPPTILNVTGPETISVRELAERLAARLGVTATFSGEPGEVAFLSNASRCHRLFGLPEIGAWELVEMVAKWLKNGGRTLGRPTKFWVRDGRF